MKKALLYAGIPFRILACTAVVVVMALLNPTELKKLNWRAGVLHGIDALDKKG